ncbi:ribosome recycling factor [Patescibacteria group bacterium]|nr:ribosome recycling factor [Patescibacteria group bacterium]
MNNEKFDKAIEHFKQELSGLRTGRASAALVEGIIVDSYGSKMPISHIASISIPDAKTIAIQPWDKSNIGPIEKAIQASNIGLNPVNDGNLVRLNIPPMTEERRKEMVKVLGQITEQARIAVRGVREEFIRDLKKQQEDNKITEDDAEGQKKDLQEVVDKYNENIKEISAAKEKEIMTI